MSLDTISRQTAIDALESGKDETAKGFIGGFYNTIIQSEIIYCRDCEWFGKAGCAINIVDDSDRPKETDFCSFAERRTDGRFNQQTDGD